MRLFVSNFPFNTTADDLREIFSDYGTVTEAVTINDRETNKPRGFGFVAMSSTGEAEEAMAALHGCEWRGREFRVQEAQPRPEHAANSLRTARQQ